MDIQDNQPMRVIEGLLRVFKPSTNPQQTLCSRLPLVLALLASLHKRRRAQGQLHASGV